MGEDNLNTIVAQPTTGSTVAQHVVKTVVTPVAWMSVGAFITWLYIRKGK